MYKVLKSVESLGGSFQLQLGATDRVFQKLVEQLNNKENKILKVVNVAVHGTEHEVSVVALVEVEEPKVEEKKKK